MSVGAWLADSHNPDGNWPDKPRWSVLLRAVVAGGMVVAFASYALPWLLHNSGIDPWAIWLILAAYLLVGYFMKPHVDTGDLETWELVIDNPFTMRDDFDRVGIFAQIAVLIIFLPAILVTHAVVDFVVLLVNIGR